MLMDINIQLLLCASYSLLFLFALIHLMRIDLRGPEYGLAIQKISHLMNSIVNGVRAVVFGFHHQVFLVHPKMAINDGAPFLSEEIIINILKRLPVKSLKRFQCVCKHWNSLIKTPSFIHHHSTHQTSSLLIKPLYFSTYIDFNSLFFPSGTEFCVIHLPPSMSPLKNIEIVGSCNGLICLVRWDNNRIDPIFWNPATREIKKLSVSGDDFSEFRYDWYFGFAFSHIINDFKMVRMFMIVSSEICGVGVYSLRDGCWRDIAFDSIKDVSISAQGVTGNGVIFWRGKKKMEEGHSLVIISFDLVTEVFRVIPWPTFASDLGTLAVYDGKLAIIFDDHAIKYKIFPACFVVMEEGAIDSSEQRWSSSENYICNGNFDSKLLPMANRRNQVVSTHLRPLYYIDVIGNRYKWLVIPQLKSLLISDIYYNVGIFNYVESLAPVSGNIETKES